MDIKKACLASGWLATLVAAYLIGGRGTGGHSVGQVAGSASSQRSLDQRGESRSGGNASSVGDSTASGLRSPGDRVDTSTRMLRMLSGAAGSDWEKSDFGDLADILALDEVQSLVVEIAAMAPGPAQRDAYQAVLNRWAELDPTAALDHVASIDSPKFRRDATMDVLRHWSAVNPSAALAFVTGDQGKDLPEGSLAYIFRGLGNSEDTSSALDFLASLKGTGYEAQAPSALRELFERNDTEVVAWASSLPAGELRDRSIETLAKEWAHYDPVAAMAWLDQNTDESNRAAALAALGESWVASDPEEAAVWATELRDGGSQNGGKVLERVMKRWIESDLASAAGYLVEQEPSPALDSALERYIQRIKNVDPDATLAWAESISDPDRRSNAIRSVAKVLRNQDPQAFTEYVDASPNFSEAERAKILGIEKPKPKKKDKTPEQKDKKRDKKQG